MLTIISNIEILVRVEEEDISKVMVCEIVAAEAHDVLVRKIVDELFEKNVLYVRREKF